MNYEQLLREHTLKVTPQRLGILDVMDHSGHISVEKLYQEIKKQFSSISLATLYKNIHAMLEKTLITEVAIPYMKPRYEITKASHGHFLCQSCGSFEDITVDLDTAMQDVSKKNNYQIDNAHLIFSGICSHCQK